MNALIMIKASSFAKPNLSAKLIITMHVSNTVCCNSTAVAARVYCTVYFTAYATAFMKLQVDKKPRSSLSFLLFWLS